MSAIKKIIITIFLLFLFFKPLVFVTAQYNPLDPNTISLPGVNCGVANDPNISIRRCCNSEALLQNKSGLDAILSNDTPDNFVVSFIRGFFTNIPALGGLVSLWTDQFKELQIRYRQLKEFTKNNPGVVCVYGDPDKAVSDPSCLCKAVDPSSANKPLAQMCYQYLSKSKELGSCISCASSGGMWTGIGCIPTKIQDFVTTFLLSTGIGLGGIIALICIIYAAFSIQTSQGNPEKIKKAQELLTSCIMGLMLIIFSIFILRLIGVNILRIPFLQ